MSYPLTPTLTGRQLTVDAALNTPPLITKRIAALTADQLVIDKFLSATGQKVEGGALLYTQASAENMYTTRDVEQRAAGAEYPVVMGERPEPKLAEAEDWGGKFFVTDEARTRNNVSEFDDNVTQLANTITRKINQRVIDAIEAAITGNGVVPGHDWNNVITSGPLDALTPNNERPAADWAISQLAADMGELGVIFDLLVLHPQEHHSLKVAYGEDLAAVLASNNLSVFTSPRLTPGTGYAVKKGNAGIMAYEKPLNTTTWRDEARRVTWVQSYAVPAIAVTNPLAIKKLTGLDG
ncbi:major capsid protein [Rhodococcus marinonascens]|uniref:major capsid protein n=1 Tax=Rhodococcus marinonascens TaxID=38311 RepID=UPI000933146C|nr:major capsid protein [Rhodococcus marinonascens]